MARKAKGSIEWKPQLNSYSGRIWQGDKYSGWHCLDTDDEKLAEERVAIWIETGEPPKDAGVETFGEACKRFLARAQAKADKPPEPGADPDKALALARTQAQNIQNRRHRLETFAIPEIGKVRIKDLKPSHIKKVLERMGEQAGASRAQYAADTVGHLLVDMSRILKQLIAEDAIAINVAVGVELPEDVEVDDRPRIVLTDGEIVRFRRRGFASELDMMALFARDLAGHRTSDLHAADYSDFDTVHWRTCTVRRPKTDREGSRKGRRRGKRRATRGYEKVKMAIPKSVVGPLKAWREAHRDPITGELPVKGPIFPLRRGPNAGQRKTGKGISYAQALRDALWEEGIVRPLPGYDQATGDERRKYCALQVDTDETRAVDFHSFRRAFVTALANAGVNAQTAMLASGHNDFTTHQRYLHPGVIEVPAHALPGGEGELLAPSLPPAPAPSSPAPESATAAGPAVTQTPARAPAREATAASNGEAKREPLDGLQPHPVSATALTVGNPLALGGDAAALRVFQDVMLAIAAALQGRPAAALPGGEATVRGSDGSGRLQGYEQGYGNNETAENMLRARKDSNLRPTASENIGERATHGKGENGHPVEPPHSTPFQPVPVQALDGTTPSTLERLRATVHAAIDEGNWPLVEALRPLLEAEQRRAASSAPGVAAAPVVSLDAARARRGEGGDRR